KAATCQASGTRRRWHEECFPVVCGPRSSAGHGPPRDCNALPARRRSSMHRLLSPAMTGLTALLLATSTASAGVPTDQLRASVDEVRKVLDDRSLRAESGRRSAGVREVAGNVFDFREAAQRSLGRHWQGLSDKDRAEFTALFTDLLERSYVSRIEQYSG